MKIFRRRFAFGAGQRMTRGFVGALRGAANVFATEVFDRPRFDVLLQLLQLRRGLLLPARKCCDEMLQLCQKQLLGFAKCLIGSATANLMSLADRCDTR